jgi:hypothetical protein
MRRWPIEASMPSPFPGMNPYLEDPDIWPDFHTTLFVEIRAELNRRLPAGYFVIAVPLTAELPAVALPLQTCVDRALAAGRYEEEFDYRKSPEPPFTGDDADWVRQRIEAVQT